MGSQRPLVERYDELIGERNALRARMANLTDIAAAKEARLIALAGYVRQLEDACEVLWGELPVAEVRQLRHEAPALSDFLCHVHDSICHEEAMVRVNVWADDPSGFDA